MNKDSYAKAQQELKQFKFEGEHNWKYWIEMILDTCCDQKMSAEEARKRTIAFLYLVAVRKLDPGVAKTKANQGDWFP